MGRRKTRKVIKREPKRLPKVFRCPRCGEQSVVVDLDRALSQGKIKCGRCQLSAELPIHTLTQTIDVYARFLDLYYGGKIEETPRAASEKPPEAMPVTQKKEPQSVIGASESGSTLPTDQEDASQPQQAEATKNPSKPIQPPETSQQAQ